MTKSCVVYYLEQLFNTFYMRGIHTHIRSTSLKKKVPNKLMIGVSYIGYCKHMRLETHKNREYLFLTHADADQVLRTTCS